MGTKDVLDLGAEDQHESGAREDTEQVDDTNGEPETGFFATVVHWFEGIETCRLVSDAEDELRLAHTDLEMATSDWLCTFELLARESVCCFMALVDSGGAYLLVHTAYIEAMLRDFLLTFLPE